MIERRKKTTRLPVSLAVPPPHCGEKPTHYADRLGQWYVGQKTEEYRKSHGLYLTPIPVADFMAGRLRVFGPKLRVLDPAAGAGVLSCAAVERLVTREAKPDSIELVVYEVEESLKAPLMAVLGYLAEWCRTRYGVAVLVRVEITDFILEHAEALRLSGGFIPYQANEQDFDVVVSNPPYFKINKADPRAAAASRVVHGQPNIYALFMAVSAVFLRKHGEMVFITPRSFSSGPYFRRFREIFFNLIRPTEIHVFESRRDAFSRDEVLQENVILSGIRHDYWREDGTDAPLAISSSRGVSDIDEPDRREISMKVALDLASVDKVLRLPIRQEDEDVLALVDSWPSSLRGLGLNISTGPVVPFRAVEFIREDGKVPARHVPLLWMNHVRPMQATWPLRRHKPEYIQRLGADALLVSNRNYVLLRRFSAKEEARRLTAAPYIAADFAVPEVGFENHLNYVHRPGGTLSDDEAWGLAALYNSRLLDVYFRTVNGNTQVSATELRAMPLPARETIIALGQRVKHLPDPTEGLDSLVMSLVADRSAQEAVALG